jgi:hypothetical protein
MWSPREAVDRLGASLTFTEARNRLYCSRCGARNGREGRISARPSVLDFYERLRRAGMGLPRRHTFS